jgi:hypothetical protein
MHHTACSAPSQQQRLHLLLCSAAALADYSVRCLLLLSWGLLVRSLVRSLIGRQRGVRRQLVHQLLLLACVVHLPRRKQLRCSLRCQCQLLLLILLLP